MTYKYLLLNFQCYAKGSFYLLVSIIYSNTYYEKFIMILKTLIMKGPVLTVDKDSQHQKLKPSSSFGFEHH